MDFGRNTNAYALLKRQEDVMSRKFCSEPNLERKTRKLDMCLLGGELLLARIHTNKISLYILNLSMQTHNYKLMYSNP